MIPVIGSKVTTPPAVPPGAWVMVLPSFAKKSSFAKILTELAWPNGAVNVSFCATGWVTCGSVPFGFPSKSQSEAFHVADALAKTWPTPNIHGLVGFGSVESGSPSPSESPFPKETAKLVWESLLEVNASPWDEFKQIIHNNGLIPGKYEIFPKIRLGALITLPLTVSKISPTSKGVKFPAALVNLIVLADPVFIEKTTHLESPPGATPKISASKPTEIVTNKEFATMLSFP